METARNLQKVSLVFFLVLGATHIFSSLMLANNYWPAEMNVLNKTLDLPFLLAALVYGGTSLKINLAKIGFASRFFDLLLTLLMTIIFAVFLYLNLFVPDL